MSDMRPLTWQGPSIAIHHPESVIEEMNDWCKEHHGKSGLTQRVRDSTTSLEEAEQQVGPCSLAYR
jgi:oligoribonuclease